MGECICNSCKNLKAVLHEEELREEYQCKHGFPSERCEDCEEETCQETCSYYIPDIEEEGGVVVKCGGCGKELLQVSEEDPQGEVFCMDCYFKR